VNLISVIITTYNWPEALAASLQSLFAQRDLSFEILIADDGSTDKTSEMVKSHFQSGPIQVKHIWHEDTGFRAGSIRNKAVAASVGDYLIFIDGDCMVFPDFISTHRKLASRGCFVPGNRILLSEQFTQTLLSGSVSLHEQPFSKFLCYRLTGKINRIFPLLRLPLGLLRKIRPLYWQKAMTCNLGLWKQDFIDVNGFDELFEGWGYEDSDLVIRLIHNGIKRKEGRFAVPVLHMWHRQNDQSQHDQNFKRLMERLQQSQFILAEKGLDQYVKPVR
jgi:glycosyltransferase involved in cell wall biosynthesis